MATTYKPYSEMLKQPAWQKRRLKELERAGWKCECCGTDAKQLQVHHLDYEYLHVADEWKKYYPPESAKEGWLEVLCNDCHEWRECFNALFGRDLMTTKLCWRIVEAIRRSKSYRGPIGQVMAEAILGARPIHQQLEDKPDPKPKLSARPIIKPARKRAW